MSTEPYLGSPLVIPSVELGLRLLVALVLGALVGIERTKHHKNAGLQTHALVSVGATAFSAISLLGFGPTNNPMLIAAGVVTGIGFIGGGVIMHRGATVQGINTAATLWATASLGLALGAGYYVFATIIFAGIVTVQFPLRWLEHRIGTTPPVVSYRLTVRMDAAAAGAVSAALATGVKQVSAEVRRLRHSHDQRRLVGELNMPGDHVSALLLLTDRLREIPGVHGVSIEHVEEPGDV